MTKAIKLANGAGTTLISDKDFGLVHGCNLNVDANGYVKIYTKGSNRRLHRVIMNAKTGEEVDHINMNKLDNRRENLRICTSSQNKGNLEVRKSNTSGFKGVNWHKRSGTYEARIKINKRSVFLGNFATAQEAANAYDKAALELRGEFARTNSYMNRSAAK